MKRPVRALTLLGLLASVAVAADGDAELKALEGAWVLDEAVLAGRDHIDDFKGMKLTLAGDRFTIDFAENSSKGTFTVDATKTPRRIDIKCETGPFKGKTLPGIYELKGDKLVLCLEADGKPENRPAKFEAPEKVRVMLLTYRREKK